MFKSITKSNYFRVTDDKKFDDIIRLCENEDIGTTFTRTKTANGITYRAFGCFGTIAGLPDPDDNDTPSLELFRKELTGILADGEAIIITTVGHGAGEDVFGEVDIITKNDWKYLNLDDIARESASNMLRSV